MGGYRGYEGFKGIGKELEEQEWEVDDEKGMAGQYIVSLSPGKAQNSGVWYLRAPYTIGYACAIMVFAQV